MSPLMSHSPTADTPGKNRTKRPAICDRCGEEFCSNAKPSDCSRLSLVAQASLPVELWVHRFLNSMSVPWTRSHPFSSWHSITSLRYPSSSVEYGVERYPLSKKIRRGACVHPYSWPLRRQHRLKFLKHSFLILLVTWQGTNASNYQSIDYLNECMNFWVRSTYIKIEDFVKNSLLANYLQ